MVKSIYKKTASQKVFHEAYHKTLEEWEVEYQCFYVPTRFGKTHIIESGQTNGEPLILLHGFGFSSTMWKDNMKSLSEKYHIYAVDFVGDMNKSEATRQIETKMDCIDWFLAVLEQLHLEKPHVMGMSYGGFLAFIFASSVPNRINKLITISPAASIQKQSMVFFLRCLFIGVFPTSKNINGVLDYMCADGSSVNPTLKKQFIIAMQNCIPRIKVFARYLSDGEFKTITHPTLLIVGEHEVQYNVGKVMERAKRMLPNLEVHLLKHAGHAVNLEQPEKVNTLVLQFLERSAT